MLEGDNSRSLRKVTVHSLLIVKWRQFVCEVINLSYIIIVK